MPEPRPHLDRTLAALADPHRRRAIELLSRSPCRPSELAEALSLSRPATSRHLRVLRDAGLVEAEELADDARGRTLRVRPEALREVGSWAAELEAAWHDQLASFVAFAESKGRAP